MKRVVLLLCLAPFAFAQIQVPNVFEDGQPAKAAEVNANFDALEAAIDATPADAIKAVTSADLDMDGNRVLFSNVYSRLADLPSASDNHGMFAHVHDTGEAYYAHAGNWIQIANHAVGPGNTATGTDALTQLTSGQLNTANGMYALRNLKEGTANTAVGMEALENVTNAQYLTAVGYNALRSSTAGRNTAVGGYALASNITGFNNSAIGYQANVTQGDIHNATAIGYNAKVQANNTVQIGDDEVTDIYLGQRASGSQNASGAADANLHTRGKLTTGAVTYPNAHGTNKQVLGTNGSGELAWFYVEDIANDPNAVSMQQRIESLESQLQVQQEELLAIVQSQQEQMTLQQEQIAQLQRMVEHQFAMN